MTGTSIDPVCGMEVDPIGAIHADHSGRTYYFCESVCAEMFRDEPERWIEPDTPRSESDATLATQPS